MAAVTTMNRTTVAFVAQTVRATCMAGECAFNLLAFDGDIGTTLADLDEAVRVHVLQTGHRVYIDDSRARIVRRVVKEE